MGSRSSARDNAIDPIKTEDEEAFLYAMQLGSASVLPMVLKCALEFDLLETIAKSGPGYYVSSSELVSRLPNVQNADACLMLDRILQLLASYSVLECVIMYLPGGGVERRYGPRPVCKYLIKDEDGVSNAPLLLMNQDKVLVESWYHLKDAIVEGGIPFNKAHGVHAFRYHATDQRFNKVFNLAMSNHSIMNMKQILEVYDGFDGVATLVDVGGGIGSSLKMIVSKYPSIKGINFNLPHVIKDAKPYRGIEYVGGDMFVSVPKADAIFMKWICHDWSDEHCLKLLKNCYKSLPDNGKVIVAECLLPEEPDYTLAAKIVVHVDVMMLTFNPGGKERTGKEFEVLAKGAGFKGFHKACFAYNTWIMEFLK